MSKTALIVGGGPAGAGAALALLGGGFDVELFERRPDFSPRVCGTFLDGEALRHLDALGLGERVRGESVSVPRVVATFPPDRSRSVDLPEAGAALPRPRLEEILIDEIRRRGGRVSMGVRLSRRRRSDPTPGRLRRGRGSDPKPGSGPRALGRRPLFHGTGPGRPRPLRVERGI
ncbi:MAG: FAD-dependent monooxygenase [Elusimicrobia bacterium]|nr:FAD-dependent monooxygenase [Elusimicrobiota bacterium]